MWSLRGTQGGSSRRWLNVSNTPIFSFASRGLWSEGNFKINQLFLLQKEVSGRVKFENRLPFLLLKELYGGRNLNMNQPFLLLKRSMGEI